MNHRIAGMVLDMSGENRRERMTIMIGSALAVDSTGGRIEEGEQIGGAVTLIFKVLGAEVVRLVAAS